MREILFRGKADKKSPFAYGNLHIVAYKDIKPQYEIWQLGGDIDKCFTVLEHTIGQFTGLKDRNGNKIFEGDILDDNDGKPSYVCVFDSGRFGFYSIKEYINDDFLCYDYDFETSICAIVGNIYDNPELLAKEI